MPSHRRRRSATATIFIWGTVLVAADCVLWALWVARWLVLLAVPVVAITVAYRRAQRRRGAQPPPLRLVRGHVVSDVPTCMHGVPSPCGICDAPADLDRAELARLRAENTKLRTKVRVLSDMLNGPEAGP
jgi:hypothetical protein